MPSARVSRPSGRSSTRLSDLGEFGLIREIRRWCRQPGRVLCRRRGFEIAAALGDDAFVAKLTTKASLVFSTDTLAEGTHYRLDWLRRYLPENRIWQALGHKIAAINLSDLAAMGDVAPLFAFMTVVARGDISVDSVDNLYAGFRRAAQKHRLFIAGGDIVRSDKSMISMTIVGKMAGTRPLTRKGARPGDILLVTGPLGLSAAGLKIIENQEKIESPCFKTLLMKHLLPEPRLRAGAALASVDIMATSLLDTSDDLATSLEILARESGVGLGVDLEAMSIDPALALFCRKTRRSPYPFMLYGGEDYELLFTVPADKVALVRRRIPCARAIGRVLPRSAGVRVRLGSRPLPFADVRFRHF